MLVVAGFVVGIALNTWLAGWPGTQQSLMGFGLAALVYVPLFILRAMGGGDVKLMAAAGAIIGPRDWLRYSFSRRWQEARSRSPCS